MFASDLKKNIMAGLAQKLKTQIENLKAEIVEKQELLKDYEGYLKEYEKEPSKIDKFIELHTGEPVRKRRSKKSGDRVGNG